jgi:agmatinase
VDIRRRGGGVLQLQEPVMKRSNDFLGAEVAGADRDRVYVIPVPVEWSVSYGAGAGSAPAALLAASMQIEVYNAGIDLDLQGAGITTLDPGIRSKEDLLSFLSGHRDLFRDALPVFLGGEHSITPWILEGLELRDFGIVWLDAHADLRESYLGERESHACAARNSLAFGPLVQIGVRSYSREERDFLRGAGGTRIFPFWNEGAWEAIRRLPENVYLSIDFDAVDPSILRAVGTPEPGGLGWEELMDLLTFVFEKKRVVAMDAVELAPAAHDETSSFIAAKIVYEAISRYLRRELPRET